jgi:membrane-associated phospholipid phosphatase
MMRRAPDRSVTSVWEEVRAHSYLLAADLILLVANAAMFVAAMLSSTPLTERAVIGAGHVLVMGLVFALARADRPEAPRGLIGFVHDWVPTLILVAMYFELSVIIPHLNPYDDHRLDKALQAFDVRVLGDPPKFFASLGARWLSDVLACCYVVYYPLLIVVPIALYARGDLQNFRTTAAIIMTAFVMTYTCYALFPALGPHSLFDGPRAPVLDGYGIAKHVYAMTHDVRGEPPDAFPSGHAMVGMLGPAMAWRFYRPLFLGLMVVGVGIVLATLYLRYHYLLDVAAGLMLAPVAWKLGTWIDRRWNERQA